jgi:hypothetical protein
LVNGRDLFASNRPGWAKPIHKLFVDNKVDIFFQGHDHVFAHEVLDGVTYQACPMPSDSTYRIGMQDNGDAYTADTFDGVGHLRVTVGPGGVKVDFVRAYLPKDTLGNHKNQEIPFTYTVGGNPAKASPINTKGKVRLFPNPGKGQISLIYADDCKKKDIAVYGMDGKGLLKANGNQMDIHQLRPGVYTVEIETEWYKLVEKLIVLEDNQ